MLERLACGSPVMVESAWAGEEYAKSVGVHLATIAPRRGLPARASGRADSGQSRRKPQKAFLLLASLRSASQRTVAPQCPSIWAPRRRLPVARASNSCSYVKWFPQNAETESGRRARSGTSEYIKSPAAAKARCRSARRARSRPSGRFRWRVDSRRSTQAQHRLEEYVAIRARARRLPSWLSELTS
jgi:hypothetical protein